jgi:DNA polymerase II small subunit/DNA polymerase delta subunit B
MMISIRRYLLVSLFLIFNEAAIIPTSTLPVSDIQQERNMYIEGLDSKKASDILINTGKELIDQGVKIVQLTFGDASEFSSQYFEKLKAEVKPKLEAVRDKLCENQYKTTPVKEDEDVEEEDEDISIQDFIEFFKNNFLTKQLCTYGRQ